MLEKDRNNKDSQKIFNKYDMNNLSQDENSENEQEEEGSAELEYIKSEIVEQLSSNITDDSKIIGS